MSQYPEVDPVEAQRLTSDDDGLLLDVREQDEWDAGHAPDALHMPLGSLSPQGLPQDRPIVAVCRSGGRSGQATEALRSAGLDVRNMSGGMSAWASRGLPVVRDDGQPGTVA